MEKYITIEVVSGIEGCCLLADNQRIAGPKPWGGGSVIHSFKVNAATLADAIGVEYPDPFMDAIRKIANTPPIGAR